jgi:hypothetical protein
VHQAPWSVKVGSAKEHCQLDVITACQSLEAL